MLKQAGLLFRVGHGVQLCGEAGVRLFTSSHAVRWRDLQSVHLRIVLQQVAIAAGSRTCVQTEDLSEAELLSLIYEDLHRSSKRAPDSTEAGPAEKRQRSFKGAQLDGEGNSHMQDHEHMQDIDEVVNRLGDEHLPQAWKYRIELGIPLPKSAFSCGPPVVG
eukprot:tig00000402_g185.t1